MYSEILHENGSYTYHFKNISEDFIQDLNLTLFEVEFKIQTRDENFNYIEKVEIERYAVGETEDGLTNVHIFGDFVGLNLHIEDDVVIGDSKFKLKQKKDEEIVVTSEKTCEDIQISNLDCVINRTVIFMDVDVK
jgi:hypothetical protein